MITPDLSEHIHRPEENRGDVDDAVKAYYLDRAFPLEGGYEIRFSERELRDAVTIYGGSACLCVTGRAALF